MSIAGHPDCDVNTNPVSGCESDCWRDLNFFGRYLQFQMRLSQSFASRVQGVPIHLKYSEIF